MKNLAKLTGIIAILAITGFSLAGCDMDAVNGGTATYAVSFEPGEGSGTPPAAQTVNAGTNITLPGQGQMTAPTGQSFNGWRTGNQNYAAGAGYTVNADTIFTAQWSQGGASYAVSFEPGEGGGTPPAAQTVSAGTNITLPDQGQMTPPEGKVFSGWEAGGQSYAAGVSCSINADTIFTARWVVPAANPPDAPTGVQATAQSSGSISVSWNPVAGADSYEVYFAAGSSADFAPAPGGTVTGASYAHTGLQAGTTYQYRVRAVNSAGGSGFSTAASATTLSSGNGGGEPTVPGAPTGAQAAAQSDTIVLITWNPVSGALGYRVYYETASSSGKIPHTGGGWEGSTGYYADGLTLDTAYTFYVTSMYWDSATNTQGESDYSSPASATTMAEPPPLPGDPSDVTATALSHNSIEVTWSPAANAASYEVSYWALPDDDGTSYDNRAKETTINTSITISGLESGIYYSFEIIALNATGRSPGYYGVNASCRTETEALVIRAVARSADKSILVSWDEAAWAVSYKLYYREGSGVTNNINVTGASYTHTGLSEGKTYYYYIEANDSSGGLERSDTVSASIAPTPTGLTAQAETGMSIRVSWTAVSGATGYTVEYQTDSSSEWTPVQETLTTTSYTHSGLTEGVTYTYRVKAAINDSESGYSTTVSRTAQYVPPAPAAPTGVTATAQSSSSVSVSWNVVSGATSYKVYYRTSSSSASTRNLAGTVTSASYTHTGLQANTTYYYYIRAVTGAGAESAYSVYASATTLSSGSGGGAAPTKLATPTNILAYSGDSFVQISWTEVSLASTYKVYRSTSANGSYSEITVSLGASGSSTVIATDSNPGTGTSYYKVQAINTLSYLDLTASDLSAYVSVTR
jgi:titin